MGIDVYTTDLAAQLRNVDGATASALRRGDRHPLTDEGLRAAAQAVGPATDALNVLRALLLARHVGRQLAVDVGNPFASLGPSSYQQPDKLDARQWHLLQAVASAAARGMGVAESLAAIDPDMLFDIEAGFLDATWDDFPGIAFARAVERANTLVLPGQKPLSFAVGHLAVTSVAEGRAFLRALVQRLSLPAATLGEDHDPEMSDEVNGILYNPRLLAFHLDEVDRSARPLGIWG